MICKEWVAGISSYEDIAYNEKVASDACGVSGGLYALLGMSSWRRHVCLRVILMAADVVCATRDGKCRISIFVGDSRHHE